MLEKKNRKEKGFTLVELIVVIAIIAILASVAIVGFTRFIENARISNDNQLAAQMTNLVSYHVQATGEDDLDAHDVREIVISNSGENISFTPQTDGGIFVYVAESQSVVFAKADEILSGAVELKSSTSIRLLSDMGLEEDPGDTPEEVFGEDTFVLSKAGSTIAEVAWGIRSLTTSSSLDNDYDALGELADGHDRLESLLQIFTLTNTLLVNDNDWPNLPSSSVEPFARILFQPGIKNIPMMTNSVHVKLTVESTIVLPRTVRSIEENAFSKVLLPPTGVTIDLSRTESLFVETGAFSSDQKTELGLTITERSFESLGVVAEHYDGSSWTSFNTEGQALTSDTKVRFNIEGTLRELIDDIVIQRVDKADGTYYVVRAYNDSSGLLGKDEFKVHYTD